MYTIIILIAIALISFTAFIGVSICFYKNNKKNKYYIKELEKEIHSAKDRINAQMQIINQMETGDDVADFNTSLNILHQYSKK